MLSTLFLNLREHAIEAKGVNFAEDVISTESIQELKEGENRLFLSSFQELLSFDTTADFATKTKVGVQVQQKNRTITCTPGKTYPCGKSCKSQNKDCKSPIEGQAASYAGFLELQNKDKPKTPLDKSDKSGDTGNNKPVKQDGTEGTEMSTINDFKKITEKASKAELQEMLKLIQSKLDSASKTVPYKEFSNTFKDTYFEMRKAASLRGVAMVSKEDISKKLGESLGIDADEFEKQFQQLQDENKVLVRNRREKQLVELVEENWETKKPPTLDKFESDLKKKYFEIRKAKSLRGFAIVSKKELKEQLQEDTDIDSDTFEKFFKKLKQQGKLTEGRDDDLIEWVE